MSRITSQDVMLWMNNSARPRFRTEYWRAQPQGYGRSIMVQLSQMNLDREQTSGINNFADGTRPIRFSNSTSSKILDDWINQLRFSDSARSRVFTDGTRPIRFTGGTRSRTSADGTRPKVFADGTKPKILADKTRPKVSADQNRPTIFIKKTKTNPKNPADKRDPWNGVTFVPVGETEQKDEPERKDVVADITVRSVGDQKYVITKVKNLKEYLKLIREDNFDLRHKRWINHHLSQLPSWAKIYQRVEVRSEHLRQKMSRPTVRKLKESNDSMQSSSSEPKTNAEYIVVDRNLVSNIVEEDMDGAIFEWLKMNGLDQHFWFFKLLSFNEIIYVTRENIYKFLDKMNKSRECIDSQEIEKICNVAKNLKERSQALQSIIKSINMKISAEQIVDHLEYMQYILSYPVPNKKCTKTQEHDGPQFEIFLVMQKIFRRLTKILEETSFLHRSSAEVFAVTKFTKCVKMICNNQLFFEYQVNGVMKMAKTLWSKIEGMKKDFST